MFLFADGAMGTELLRRAVPPFSCLEMLTLEQPAVVAAIHRDYRAAGADLLTTNSFGANVFRLAAHGLEGRVREINLAATRLARDQAEGALVAGAIGPSGEQQPLPPEHALQEAFAEQAKALEEGSVDLFSCETFGDVGEARAAVLGVRAVSRKPILLQMTYRPDSRTPAGLTPGQVVAALRDLPLSAIGVNCAIGEETAERVLPQLRPATDLPLIAQPNAGQPRVVDGLLRYPLGPKAFAEQARRLRGLASIVGGCCGTTPDHIAALRLRVGYKTMNESE